MVITDLYSVFVYDSYNTYKEPIPKNMLNILAEVGSKKKQTNIFKTYTVNILL